MRDDLRKNRGFTLIELIVVIAVIGILALLAAPKFSGHTEEARLTQIKSDIVSYEDAIETERIRFAMNAKDGDPFISDSFKVDKPILIDYAENGELFYRGGLATTKDLSSDYYYSIEDNVAKSKLKGKFFMDKEGKVFYHETQRINEPEGEKPDEETSDDYMLLTDDDFEFVETPFSHEQYVINGKTLSGYFHYIGEYEKVAIPWKIMGNNIESYYRMFAHNEGKDPMTGVEYTGKNGVAVTSVCHDNPYVTNMEYMFYHSIAESLDLSNFNTSNVTHMSEMFSYSYISSLDLSNFDVSNVTSARGMFSYSHAETIDLSSFDINRGRDEMLMFSYAKVKLIKAKNESIGRDFEFLSQATVTWPGK